MCLGLACGIYLCWLGVRGQPREAGADGRTVETTRPMLRGLAFGLSNPKAYPVAVAMFTALLAGRGCAGLARILLRCWPRHAWDSSRRHRDLWSGVVGAEGGAPVLPPARAVGGPCFRACCSWGLVCKRSLRQGRGFGGGFKGLEGGMVRHDRFVVINDPI